MHGAEGECRQDERDAHHQDDEAARQRPHRLGAHRQRCCDGDWGATVDAASGSVGLFTTAGAADALKIEDVIPNFSENRAVRFPGAVPDDAHRGRHRRAKER